MNNKILTISVASYNLENIIETNLQSFLKSKYINDIEIIITDDESTDNTRNIVEKYIKICPDSFKLIKQKNTGPGSTVNSGMKNAVGKYFKMVDGDDWVNTDNFDKLVEFLKEHDVDMIINDHLVYSDIEKKITNAWSFDDFIPNKIMNINEMKEYIGFSMHDVTYKTSILKNNNITLDNGFYTDLEYLLLPFKYVKTYIYLNYAVYIYRVARIGQSVSYNSMKKNVKQHEKVVWRIIQLYENTENIFIKKIIGERLVSLIDTHICILLSFKHNKKDKKEIIRLIQYLKKNEITIYNRLKDIKKEKMLINSNFILYPIVSYIVRMKQNNE